MTITKFLTSPPERTGERCFYNALDSLCDSRLHAWFSIDQLQGIRDIDALLWHEEAGVFVVEIKAVELDDVLEYWPTEHRITGRTEARTPHKQALEAMFSLINTLPLGREFFCSFSVAWPKIARRDWVQRFPDPIVRRMADSMLFQEDLETSSSLCARLAHIWRHPPARVGSNRVFRHNPELLEKLALGLDPRRRPAISSSELDRIGAISTKIRADILRKFPPQDSRRLIMTGLPGTGKTFRLLQLAREHVAQGRSVLYCCFNKVLATDIRQLFFSAGEMRNSSDSIDVYDIWDLALKYTSVQRSGSYAEWGQAMVRELSGQNLEHYDTILIDETQDMGQWMFELLEPLSSPTTSWCLALGTGQELYGAPSPWVQQFKEAATVEHHGLRRVFRNSKSVFRVAQTFYECKLDPNRAEHLYSLRFEASRNPRQQEMEFERSEGTPHSLIPLPRPTGAEDPRMAEHYARIIRTELQRQGPKEVARDILVLIPSEKAWSASWARQALGSLQKAQLCEFIDYASNEARRLPAQPQQIRLCTFMSARGIEGLRVIIFGLEDLQTLKHLRAPENLGYIVLSRSILESVICFSKTTSVIQVVQEILSCEEASRKRTVVQIKQRHQCSSEEAERWALNALDAAVEENLLVLEHGVKDLGQLAHELVPIFTKEVGDLERARAVCAALLDDPGGLVGDFFGDDRTWRRLLNRYDPVVSKRS